MILLIPGDHVAVDRNAGAAVEVDARPVAAAQVAEHVAAARLQRGRPYQDRVYQVKNNTYCFFSISPTEDSRSLYLLKYLPII